MPCVAWSASPTRFRIHIGGIRKLGPPMVCKRSDSMNDISPELIAAAARRLYNEIPGMGQVPKSETAIEPDPVSLHLPAELPAYRPPRPEARQDDQPAGPAPLAPPPSPPAAAADPVRAFVQSIRLSNGGTTGCRWATILASPRCSVSSATMRIRPAVCPHRAASAPGRLTSPRSAAIFPFSTSRSTAGRWSGLITPLRPRSRRA